MTIDIKTLSESDLKQKIENIKAEREKTADALKRYEDELEKRKKLYAYADIQKYHQDNGEIARACLKEIEK